MSYFDDFDQIHRFLRQADDALDLIRRQDRFLMEDRLLKEALSGQGQAERLLADAKWSVGKAAADYFESPSYKAIQGLEEQIKEAAVRGADFAGVLRKNVANAVSQISGSAAEQALRESQMLSSQAQFSLRSLVERDLDWSRTLAAATQEVSAKYELARSLEVDRLAEELRRDTTWLQAVREAASPALEMLAMDLRMSVARGNLTPAIANGFGAQLLSYISEAEEASSEEEIVAVLQALVAWFLEQIKRLSPSTQSLKALLQILAWIFPILYGQHLSNQTDLHIDESEARIIHHIEDSERKIIDHLATLQPQEQERKGYVVLKASRLREGPGASYRSIRALPPNLFVEEIGQEGDWVHIEFFDYAEGKSVRGWIARRLLVEKND